MVNKLGFKVFMDARGTVTAEEGDRYPLKPPQIMKLDFDQKYSEWLLELSNYDLDMFKYLRGYDFSLDRMKKAK